MLDEYEKVNGFKFPTSYRDFIKIFGPGELGEEYVIRAPGYFQPEKSTREQRFNLRTDLACFNDRIRNQPISEETINKYFSGDGGQISRLVYFAETSIGELIGWDPCDVRSNDSLEYGIYILPRESDHLTLFVESFASFVQEVFFGIRYLQLVNPSTKIPEDASALLLPKSFRPAGY